MPDRIRWFALGAALLVVAGGVWFGKARRAARAAQSTAPASSSAAAPRTVEVVTPQRRTMSRVLDVPATMQAFERADLYAKVSGYVREVRVDIGDAVRTGDVLMILEVPEMASELAQAEAVLAARRATLDAVRSKAVRAALMVETAAAEELARQSESELQAITTTRKEELFNGRAIPQQEYDEARIRLSIAQAQVNMARARRAAADGDRQAAEADVKVAEAEVGVAQANVARFQALLEYSSITAPFDGVVTQRWVDRGALVQAATSGRTTPLLAVQRIDQLRVFIEVPESDVAFVQAGVKASIKPYGRSGTTDGQVARIAESLNPATRTMRTEIDLLNRDRRLYDGMYAQVTLEIDRRENVLTLPAAALLTESAESYVFVAREGRAARTPIKTGLDDGIHIEVTQGIDDGALVIVAGKGLITDEMQIEAVQRAGTP